MSWWAIKCDSLTQKSTEHLILLVISRINKLIFLTTNIFVVVVYCIFNPVSQAVIEFDLQPKSREKLDFTFTAVAIQNSRFCV